MGRGVPHSQSEDKNGVALKWFASRKPERYSSAAPMSADARQRIVFEIVDFSEPLIMTVSVGPIPPSLEGEPGSWSAEDVAEAILKEKSTGRVTNGQRVALSSVEEARSVTRDGTDYYLYEHVSQGSPNMNVRESPSPACVCGSMRWLPSRALREAQRRKRSER
jgi:hypothetical protein